MKKLLCAVLALCLVFAGCSALAATSYADIRQKYFQNQTCLSRGDTGDEVATMQFKLYALGYLDGAVDGDFGSGTEKALKAFQSAQCLECTGQYDADTRSALENLYDGSLDNVTSLVHGFCNWKTVSSGNQLKFRSQVTNLDYCRVYDAVTMYYYCEDIYGCRVCPEYGEYYYETSYVNLGEGDRAYTDFAVFDNADDIYSVHVAVAKVHSTDGTTIEVPDNALLFIQYIVQK